jgi:hypothetical protein
LVLQAWGLLKYHVVGDPHHRGNALVLQTPRNTTMLVERATRIEWVVDMWPRGYPQPPDVMTVKNGFEQAHSAPIRMRKSGAHSCRMDSVFDLLGSSTPGSRPRARCLAALWR